jgi:glycosyltransferase involved in cell wall biosynthesis
MDRNTSLPDIAVNREFILSIASFEHKKGLDVLIRAFAVVHSVRPGLALVLIGRSSDAEEDLQGLATSLGVGGDVLFVPNLPHSQIGLFLERAKMFCLPSRDEPFGIALLEAGAYHLPVVASRVGGIPEFVLEGETGLLVEPDDSTGLASAINRIFSEPQLACKLAENLHNLVASKFTCEGAYKAYRDLTCTNRA